MIEDDKIIYFEEQETMNLDWPHNEALVIEIILSDCEITRSLIDTGSLVKIIYKDILEKMKLTDQ